MSDTVQTLLNEMNLRPFRGLDRRARAYQRVISLLILSASIVVCGFVASALRSLEAGHPTIQVVLTSAALAPLLGFLTNYGTGKQLVRYGLAIQQTVFLIGYTAVLTALLLFLLKSSLAVSRLALSATFLLTMVVASAARMLMVWRNRSRVGSRAERALVIEDGRHSQGNPSNTVRLCGFDIERARRDPDMLGALAMAISRKRGGRTSRHATARSSSTRNVSNCPRQEVDYQASAPRWRREGLSVALRAPACGDRYRGSCSNEPCQKP